MMQVAAIAEQKSVLDMLGGGSCRLESGGVADGTTGQLVAAARPRSACWGGGSSGCGL